MTLTEAFVTDEVFIDFETEIIYGSDQVNICYPCRFPTVGFQLMATNGLNKARALAATVEGEVSQKWTCSALQRHNGAIIACDEAACGELTVDTYKYFLDIERTQRL